MTPLFATQPIANEEENMTSPSERGKILLMLTKLSPLTKLNREHPRHAQRPKANYGHTLPLQVSILAAIPGQNKILMTWRAKVQRERVKEGEANSQKQKEKNRTL